VRVVFFHFEIFFGRSKSCTRFVFFCFLQFWVSNFSLFAGPVLLISSSVLVQLLLFLVLVLLLVLSEFLLWVGRVLLVLILQVVRIEFSFCTKFVLLFLLLLFCLLSRQFFHSELIVSFVVYNKQPCNTKQQQNYIVSDTI
jgi:hypothetical protein